MTLEIDHLVRVIFNGRQAGCLDLGAIEMVVRSAMHPAGATALNTNPEVIEKIRTEADYFERNAERMRYPKFRRQHLFVALA